MLGTMLLHTLPHSYDNSSLFVFKIANIVNFTMTNERNLVHSNVMQMVKKQICTLVEVTMYMQISLP